MIAKVRSISHGSAMTNYATKHNRADMVLTRNLGEGLTPLAMWGAMETIHQKYEPKFRRKPVTKLLQGLRNQNEEIMSFIKSCQGVFLSPKVFWWWAGISYVTSLYSLWCLLQMTLQWLKY